MIDKRVTIVDISRRLNVSPTTVAKALNGKPKISRSLREEVLKIAGEMNYVPNKSAKALSRNDLNIGVIYPVEPKEFYRYIEKGVRGEVENLLDCKVKAALYPVDGLHDVINVKNALIELYERGVDGIVLSPGLNSGEYGAELIKLMNKNIPVVYLVNELENAPGLGCVRMDGTTAGRIAAQFLHFCLYEKRNVVVFSCNKEILVQRECINGFIQEANSHELTVKGVFETQDDKKIAYYLTEKILSDMPDVHGVYVSSYNTVAVCDCLRDQKKSDSIKIIGQDIYEEMLPCMRDGTQRATLFQDPYEQGKRAVRILYNHLIGAAVPESYYKITPQIVFTSNLDAFMDKII